MKLTDFNLFILILSDHICFLSRRSLVEVMDEERILLFCAFFVSRNLIE